MPEEGPPCAICHASPSVNDLGVIVEWGDGDDGHRHGFMLVPLPDR
jgi:hypothetical protein